MRNEFDLIVLGSGPAGSGVAMRCARKGWRVALIENRVPGGTCALRGCNPKKVLTGAAELLDTALRNHGRLGRYPRASVDWPELVAFERSFTDPVPDATRRGFESAGVRLVEGRPRFRSRDELEVDGEALGARHFLIATGARPADLALRGEELVTTSDEFLFLDKLPRDALFVGGGFVSFELGHVAARLGTEVAIVDRNPVPLRAFDSELVGRLIEASTDLGVEVATGVELARLEPGSGGRIRAYFPGRPTREFDRVVHGGGRVPNLDGLDLSAAEVEHGPRGVKVDAYLRSPSNPKVLAAGDCADTDAPAVTPAANAHAHAIVRNLLAGADSTRPDVEGIATVLFSLPPLARAGLSEQQAAERGLEIEVRAGDMTGWSSVRKVGGTCAHFKLVLARADGRILGAHLLGPGAAETINLFTLAIRYGATAGELKSAPLAFPTFAHDVREML